MEIIIKNWDELSLTNIPDNELELVKENNEVITEYTISDEDRIKLGKWCILNSDMTITETEQYIKNIEFETKLQKKEAIEKIASLSDQLNLTAWTLDIVVDLLAVNNPELLEHPWIIASKTKLNEIKTILNN